MVQGGGRYRRLTEYYLEVGSDVVFVMQVRTRVCLTGIWRGVVQQNGTVFAKAHTPFVKGSSLSVGLYRVVHERSPFGGKLGGGVGGEGVGRSVMQK